MDQHQVEWNEKVAPDLESAVARVKHYAAETIRIN